MVDQRLDLCPYCQKVSELLKLREQIRSDLLDLKERMAKKDFQNSQQSTNWLLVESDRLRLIERQNEMCDKILCLEEELERNPSSCKEHVGGLAVLKAVRRGPRSL